MIFNWNHKVTSIGLNFVSGSNRSPLLLILLALLKTFHMSVKSLLLCLIYLVPFMANANWEPSEPVDPSNILSTASDDRQSGNYERALEKHIWFHHNALKYEQSLYGVRLSFALSDWVKLSNEFEPALLALEYELHEAENKLLSEENRDREDFHDFASINRELDRFIPVINLFKYFDEVDTEFSKRNFGLVQPFLIQAKEYELYAKYLNPKKDIARIQENYSMNLDMAQKPMFGSEMKEYAEKSYIESVSTMVAILTVTNKSEEAIEIAEISLSEMNTEQLKKRLEKALSGEVPKSWP